MLSYHMKTGWKHGLLPHQNRAFRFHSKVSEVSRKHNGNRRQRTLGRASANEMLRSVKTNFTNTLNDTVSKSAYELEST